MNAQSHAGPFGRAPPAGPEPQMRRELLRDNLLVTVDHLHHRRANLIDAGDIEDYVALRWLEWNGGALRLTDTGHTMCNELSRL